MTLNDINALETSCKTSSEKNLTYQHFVVNLDKNLTYQHFMVNFDKTLLDLINLNQENFLIAREQILIAFFVICSLIIFMLKSNSLAWEVDNILPVDQFLIHNHLMP